MSLIQKFLEDVERVVGDLTEEQKTKLSNAFSLHLDSFNDALKREICTKIDSAYKEEIIYVPREERARPQSNRFPKNNCPKFNSDDDDRIFLIESFPVAAGGMSKASALVGDFKNGGRYANFRAECLSGKKLAKINYNLRGVGIGWVIAPSKVEEVEKCLTQMKIKYEKVDHQEYLDAVTTTVDKEKIGKIEEVDVSKKLRRTKSSANLSAKSSSKSPRKGSKKSSSKTHSEISEESERSSKKSKKVSKKEVSESEDEDTPQSSEEDEVISKNKNGNMEDTEMKMVVYEVPYRKLKGGDIQYKTAYIGTQAKSKSKGLKSVTPLVRSERRKCEKKGLLTITEDVITRITKFDNDLAERLEKFV
jgi:hypothetical protein